MHLNLSLLICEMGTLLGTWRGWDEIGLEGGVPVDSRPTGLLGAAWLVRPEEFQKLTKAHAPTPCLHLGSQLN